MDTKSNDKTKWLVGISLILGMISFWLVLSPFLRVPENFSGEHNAWAEYRFSSIGHRLWGESLIFGLPGYTTAVIALRRNRSEGDDKKIRDLAAIGLILNILVIVAASLLSLFTPTLRYPDFQSLPDNVLP